MTTREAVKAQFGRTNSQINFDILREIHEENPKRPCRERWVEYLKRHPEMKAMIENPKSGLKFTIIADDDPRYRNTADPEMAKRQSHLVLMWVGPNGTARLCDATPGIERSRPKTNFRLLREAEYRQAHADVFDDIWGEEALAIERSVVSGSEQRKVLKLSKTLEITSYEKLSNMMKASR